MSVTIVIVAVTVMATTTTAASFTCVARKRHETIVIAAIAATTAAVLLIRFVVTKVGWWCSCTIGSVLCRCRRLLLLLHARRWAGAHARPAVLNTWCGEQDSLLRWRVNDRRLKHLLLLLAVHVVRRRKVGRHRITLKGRVHTLASTHTYNCCLISRSAMFRLRQFQSNRHTGHHMFIHFDERALLVGLIGKTHKAGTTRFATCIAIHLRTATTDVALTENLIYKITQSEQQVCAKIVPETTRRRPIPAVYY
jgi:hypothetical protein